MRRLRRCRQSGGSPELLRTDTSRIKTCGNSGWGYPAVKMRVEQLSIDDTNTGAATVPQAGVRIDAATEDATAFASFGRKQENGNPAQSNQECHQERNDDRQQDPEDAKEIRDCIGLLRGVLLCDCGSGAECSISLACDVARILLAESSLTYPTSNLESRFCSRACTSNSTFDGEL